MANATLRYQQTLNSESLQEIRDAFGGNAKAMDVVSKAIIQDYDRDLAEAYFQLALTYQKMENKANSEEYFHKAMDLWIPEQIDAPKQIERVLKAMNT
jgi:hypothetical protein